MAENKQNGQPSQPLLSSSSGVVDGRANKLKSLNPVTGESDEPILVGFEDVSAAAYRIRKGVRKTPCDVSKN